MQVALLAYDALPSALQHELSALLRQHPRFAEDFLARLPPELTSDAARERWLFAHASTWPDLARGQPGYDHGSWHYVNLPLYLRGGRLVSCAEARAAFTASLRRRSEPPPASLAEAAPGGGAQLSIRQALPKAQRTLGDARASAEERALALSWILHLVGDAHQPLHGVALFSARRFIGGDRGGNDILITGRGSLHRVWDGLLGDDASPAAVEQGLARLRGNEELTELAQSATRELALDRWIDESCELARDAVYGPAVLRAVQASERLGGEGKPELGLSESYLQAASATARRRAVQAGARLARWLMDDWAQPGSTQFNIERGLRP